MSMVETKETPRPLNNAIMAGAAAPMHACILTIKLTRWTIKFNTTWHAIVGLLSFH